MPIVFALVDGNKNVFGFISVVWYWRWNPGSYMYQGSAFYLICSLTTGLELFVRCFDGGRDLGRPEMVLGKQSLQKARTYVPGIMCGL